MSKSRSRPSSGQKVGRIVARLLWVAAIIWWVVAAIQDNKQHGYEAAALFIFGLFVFGIAGGTAT